MKLDVLSGLEELKVGMAYELDGCRIDAPPALASDWEACTPIYETFPGWEADVTGVRRFGDLPAEARSYIRVLQELLAVPVEMICVGAERECVIETRSGVPVSA